MTVSSPFLFNFLLFCLGAPCTIIIANIYSILNNIYVKFQIDFLFIYKKYGLLKFSFQKTVYVFLLFFYYLVAAFSKTSKPSLCTSRTQTRKSFHLSSHNTSLLRPPLLLYRTRPLSFHEKAVDRISVSDILLDPLTGAHSENWQLLCLSTLEIYSSFQKCLPPFPKGNTPDGRTLFPEGGGHNNSFPIPASSIGNNPRCPGRIPFYGFESVSGNRCHNPCMGKCAISPEDYHISDFGVCIFCKSVPKIRAVHIWIVL